MPFMEDQTVGIKMQQYTNKCAYAIKNNTDNNFYKR